MSAAKRPTEVVMFEAELPHGHGVECSVYSLLADATKHLRERVYIEVEIDGHVFRPSTISEHFPMTLFARCQRAAGVKAYGEGRDGLPVGFRIVAPAGSDGAQEAQAALKGALAGAVKETGEMGSHTRTTRAFFAHARVQRASGLGNPYVGAAYRPPHAARSPLPDALVEEKGVAL